MSRHLAKKEKMQIKRHAMPEQDARERATNFSEVSLGYTREQALKEAQRCLQCKKPLCIESCPVHVKINEFIDLIVNEDFLGAAAKLKEDNALPAVCGRVCPQEKQCESTCVMGKKFDPVAIGRLERFVADIELNQDLATVPNNSPTKTGKKVAVIGSGPAGLACAGDLIAQGHDVTVFEALHELGGVLVYGIPEFRLPKEIVRKEIDKLRKKGVDFQPNVVVGQTITIEELQNEEGYDAVFIGVGAGLPWFMNIPGENLAGVYSANEFLTRLNLMKANNPEFDSPILNCQNKNVAVIGGGNTAMDAVRTLRRLQTAEAFLIYRRSEEEMPARLEEALHAKEEGVHFLTLTQPLEFIGNEKGKVTAIKCVKMQLGEPDQSGRRRPTIIEGTEFTLSIEMAIVAIGNGSNPLIQGSTEGLQFNARGNIVVDETTMKTSVSGVFAGGDIVSGGATVIKAMGAGRQAAKGINSFLKGPQKAI